MLFWICAAGHIGNRIRQFPTPGLDETKIVTKQECVVAFRKIKDYFSQKQYNSKAFEDIEFMRNTIETIEYFTMKHWLLNNK